MSISIFYGPNSRCNHGGVSPSTASQRKPLFTLKRQLFARGLQSVRISEDFYTKIRVDRSRGQVVRIPYGY